MYSAVLVNISFNGATGPINTFELGTDHCIADPGATVGSGFVVTIAAV